MSIRPLLRVVGNDLRLGEIFFVLGFLRSALLRFSFSKTPDYTGQSRSLKSSTVALILECNELAVIDVSRARLPGQLFVQLLPSSKVSLPLCILHRLQSLC